MTCLKRRNADRIALATKAREGIRQWAAIHAGLAASVNQGLAALGQLLDTATASVRSGDIASRIDAQQQLNEFTLESPNAIAAEPNDIARKAVDAI